MNMLASFTRSLAASSMQGDARRAALVLHALQEADRGWLLDNLAASQRALLSALLEELRQLGLPADPALVDEAIRAASADTGGDGCRRQSDTVLEHADAQVLARVLASEPPALIARLLRMREWRWADALLLQLGPMQQAKVREILGGREPQTGRNSSRLDQQLLEHLQRRLEQAARPENATYGSGAADALLQTGSMWSRVVRKRFA